MDADTDTDQGGDDSSGDGYSADSGDSDTGDSGASSDDGTGDYSDEGGDGYSDGAGDGNSGDAGSDDSGDSSADGYGSDGQGDGSGGSDDLSGYAADSMGASDSSDSSDTMSLGEKAHSLALAGGAALYDGYDRVAAVYDMVTGDDAGADRHMEDADAESDSLWRNLRQGFEGKRIEPSLSEKQRIQRMVDEA